MGGRTGAGIPDAKLAAAWAAGADTEPVRPDGAYDDDIVHLAEDGASRGKKSAEALPGLRFSKLYPLDDFYNHSPDMASLLPFETESNTNVRPCHL